MGCHLLLQGILPTQGGIKPWSPALAGRLFTTEPPGKPFSDLLISVCGDTCDKLLGVGFCLLIILDVKFWEGAVSGKAVFRCHEVEPV